MMPDGAAPDSPPPPQTFALNVTSVDTTFATEDHFIASVEMQLSGEPFAQAMGRDLGGYSRDYSCQASVCSPSIYYDPDATGDGGTLGAWWISQASLPESSRTSTRSSR